MVYLEQQKKAISNVKLESLAEAIEQLQASNQILEAEIKLLENKLAKFEAENERLTKGLENAEKTMQSSDCHRDKLYKLIGLIHDTLNPNSEEG